MAYILPDLIIRNVQVFNSYFKTFHNADVSVKDGKFYYISGNQTQQCTAEKVIDGQGRYMVPGLIDIHMHIESSMMTPSAFCEHLVSCGVTTIVSEPHEMANVNGLCGIKDMIKAGADAQVDVYYGIPSCVPSTSEELETTGGTICFQDMMKLKEDPSVVCVGEVMNYRQIIRENKLEISKFLSALRETDKLFPIEGHCPALVDEDLAVFLFLGINGDHTEHNLEELRQRIAGGMFVEIQEKMLRRDVLEFLEQNNLYEHFCFVTDDVMADEFYETGHLDALVRKAIRLGMKPEDAIYQATFTSARRMNFFDRGAIAPGKLADFVLISELGSFTIDATYKKGLCIYDRQQTTPSHSSYLTFPSSYYHSICLNPQNSSQFQIQTDQKETVSVRVMEIQDGSTKTAEKIVSMKVKDGHVCWEDSGCLLAVVMERYGKNGGIGYGFLTGDCHKSGAVATSYAHDCHNVLIAGSNAEDMAAAVNRLIQLQGGIVVSSGKEIRAELQLNIGGILSERSAEEIGTELKQVRESMISLGYHHYNPIMSFCTVTLPVSPELKLTDKGLILVKESSIVPLFISPKTTNIY